MAAWLLGDAKAREKCIEWLHDWVHANPPFTGLNWTSGLETGIRLIQFTWIDSMLAAAEVPNKTLDELRNQILPPHTSYTWRYKSFGSSANNHLIGELAGLIVALARWPELARFSAPLPQIASRWEREVLLQFAPDGGNNEQALGYHLFSWEFCWQAQRWVGQAPSPLPAGASPAETTPRRSHPLAELIFRRFARRGRAGQARVPVLPRARGRFRFRSRFRAHRGSGQVLPFGQTCRGPLGFW